MNILESSCAERSCCNLFIDSKEKRKRERTKEIQKTESQEHSVALIVDTGNFLSGEAGREGSPKNSGR